MEKIIAKSQLQGRGSRPTFILERLIQMNSLNRTGKTDFNKYGTKNDGFGLEQCTNMFVDNFLFQVIVPDYHINEKREYVHVGTITKNIYDKLHAVGFSPIKVKAVALNPIKKFTVSQWLLTQMHERDIKRETSFTTYYWQEFKISCAELKFETVLSYLRSGSYCQGRTFLKDIDVTIDLTGSFNRDELVQELCENHGFRLQGSDKHQPRTIIDNERYVGKNCLTFIERVDDFVTRAKVYNKMVQMLESKSVRSTVGQHWRSWALQEKTNLAIARDEARKRGLTRAEITFYCLEDDGPRQDRTDIPTDDQIEQALGKLIGYIPETAVYSTSHVDTWKAYCDTFCHSLIVVDKKQNRAILVYSYNEITKNISGIHVHNWDINENHCTTSLTLGENIPIDKIEVYEMDNNSNLTIRAERFFKTAKGLRNANMTTRLVSNGGLFTYTNINNERNMENRKRQNEDLVIKAGLVPHHACIPILAHTAANSSSRPHNDLVSMGPIEVVVQMPSSETERDAQMQRRVERIIQSIREFKERRKKIMEEQERCHMFKEALRNKPTKLNMIPLGTHDVWAIKEGSTRFILVLDVFGTFINCYANQAVAETIQNALTNQKRQDLEHPTFGFMSLVTKPMATLSFLGSSYTSQKNIVVHCKMIFTPDMAPHLCLATYQNTDSSQQSNAIPDNLQTIDPRCESLSHVREIELKCVPFNTYQHLPNLTTLQQNSVHMVVATAHVMHRNKARMVLKLDDGHIYQAGRDVEEKAHQLTKDCKIKIGRTKTDLSSRHKYASCIIADKDDWAALVSFTDICMLPVQSKRKEIKVKDIATIENKGIKRKFILTEDNVVYKLQKSKFADTVKVEAII